MTLALNWVLERRTDPKTGLIIRPHTTDWGDVELSDDGIAPGSAAPTVWTASIYDQAVTYRALREMAIMASALGDRDRAETYDRKADTLRDSTHQALWIPADGYFRTHVHVGTSASGMPATLPNSGHHNFDEDEIVSVANAIAVYAGLANDIETSRIITVLERARLASGSPLAGVSLFPAYPAGTFRNAQMSPGSYQNGAVWDWWAGTQIMAEFARGYSNAGFAHLAAISRAGKRTPKTSRNGAPFHQTVAAIHGCPCQPLEAVTTRRPQGQSARRSSTGYSGLSFREIVSPSPLGWEA
ncbi:MAG: hypothetical protein EBZ89_07130 [Chloroflexi bacterium]|nr:hypothetical protein [Chloroflexota bacterium]